MSLGDAVGSLGGFYGSILGDILTQGERERRRQSIQDERALYEGLPTNLKPEEEAVVGLGPSAYESLSMDPAGRLAQLDTLQRMQGIAAAGGLDPQARAAIAQSRAANAQQERAARGAILDSFTRRGAGGSPGALVAALAAQQGSAQRAGMEGLQAAGDANTRAYRALADAGALAGAIRGADYQQASDLAGTRDRFAQFNAQNRQAVAARNNATRNQFTQGNADLAYRRAGLVGGTYGAERENLTEEERRKRNLSAGIGGQIGRNIGTGADWVFGTGAP